MISQALLVVIIITLVPPASAYISIITGANGFVGRHVVYTLLLKHYQDPPPKPPENGGGVIVCLVRPDKVSQEELYWQAHVDEIHQSSPQEEEDRRSVQVLVRPYDMLDNGDTLMDALHAGIEHSSTVRDCPVCIYHIASVFGPTLDPIRTARDNVKSTECVITTLDTFYEQYTNIKPRVVITSSMAAVRATDQIPLNGVHYTHRDWSTLSELRHDNWGSCYQWSKGESERKAWGLVRACNEKYVRNGDGGIEMVALCPSFVFGPPPPMPHRGGKKVTDATKLGTTGGSSSYSLTLIGQWLRGESPVQSRLCADVRDVAIAHVTAGTMKNLPIDDVDRRYIVSSERRLSSEATAQALMRGVQRAQEKNYVNHCTIDSSKIMFDTQFTGGAIKIGEREAEASERLVRDLGVVCRPVEETMQDTAEALLSFGETYLALPANK